MKCPTCGATCHFRGNRDFNNTEYWRCEPCQRTWIVVDHLPSDPNSNLPLDESLTRKQPSHEATGLPHSDRDSHKRFVQAQIGADEERI